MKQNCRNVYMFMKEVIISAKDEKKLQKII